MEEAVMRPARMQRSNAVRARKSGVMRISARPRPITARTGARIVPPGQASSARTSRANPGIRAASAVIAP